MLTTWPIKDGVARIEITREEAFNKAEADIKYSRDMTQKLVETGFIASPPEDMLERALDWAVKQVS